MRILKWILPIIVLAAAVMVFMQLRASKPEIPPKQAEERAWTVHAVTITPEKLSPQIELYAEVETPQEVSLTASMAADVAELNALEGSRFSKGDLLIALDTSDIDLQIEQQEAQLASLEAQLVSENLQYETDQQALKIEEEMLRISERSLRRQKDLSTRNLASQESLDTAEINTQQRYLNLVSRRQSIANHPNRVAQLEASIKQARAQLASLKLDRERALVHAPFDGRVISTSVAVGDRMRSGDQLAQIYPDSQLEIRAQLPLKVLPLIKQADGSLPALSGVVDVDGKLLDVYLSRLSAEVASGSAGIDGLFRFKDTQVAPEPGRTLGLTLNLPEVEGLIELPPSALYGTDRVYQVADNRLSAIKVEHFGDRKAGNNGASVLVRSPALDAGDRIITTQLPNAVSGMLVEVTE